MYLSKLTLNPSNKQARRDLANPYELHATLAWAISDPEHERLLWRLEDNHHTPTLLVQTLTHPDWSALLARHPEYAQADSHSPKHFDADLQPGQRLRFRLKANPTVTQKDPDNLEKRKRHGLKDVKEQLKWLTRRGQKGGFTVLGAMVAQSERLQMTKHKGGKPITVQSVLYEGHLKIADLDAFKQTLASGLGHAKALGFGLLSVAKG